MSSYLDKYSDKLCAQRKHDGDPCQSRALRGEKFCHYHKIMGMPKINMDNSPSGHTYLPLFEDSVSIQSAISDVCEMMLHRRIETREASILLYAMQVASNNMAHMNGGKNQRKQKSQKPSQEKAQNSNIEPSAAMSTDAPAANNSSTGPSQTQRFPPENSGV